MNYKEFQKQMNLTRKNICREVYLKNRNTIQIKKEETIIRNLEKIFSAALKISNRKGFQAMSMRDLAAESGLSTGALYAYFSSKEELMTMMQLQRITLARRFLETCATTEVGPVEKLQNVIRTHLYLSESMQSWFYFSYMEARNLSKAQREKTVAGSLSGEMLIADIIREGREKGLFKAHDPLMCASLIKSMLQNWYLNRRKYAGRSVTVDQYANFLLMLISDFLTDATQKRMEIRDDF